MAGQGPLGVDDVGLHGGAGEQAGVAVLADDEAAAEERHRLAHPFQRGHLFREGEHRDQMRGHGESDGGDGRGGAEEPVDAEERKQQRLRDDGEAELERQLRGGGKPHRTLPGSSRSHRAGTWGR
ncbi:hypothetical protein ABZ905_19915 [Streptomyces parvus]|uniref:hypothetical protein n=1 Tax=Streptomyces parvus TaxID=66428 RepID=UPI0034050DE0